jgi:hypothetical protein
MHDLLHRGQATAPTLNVLNQSGDESEPSLASGAEELVCVVCGGVEVGGECGHGAEHAMADVAFVGVAIECARGRMECHGVPSGQCDTLSEQNGWGDVEGVDGIGDLMSGYAVTT